MALICDQCLAKQDRLRTSGPKLTRFSNKNSEARPKRSKANNTIAVKKTDRTNKAKLLVLNGKNLKERNLLTRNRRKCHLNALHAGIFV